jgi:transcriptional regulator with XRE-family HTH domain
MRMAEARRALKERTTLRERREILGYTQASIAAALNVSPSTYKSWEAGGTLRNSKRPALAETLGVDLEQLDSILNGEEATAPAGQNVPHWLTLHGGLEQGASQIWTFQPFTVYALLQTPAYAMAVERIAPVPVSEEGAGLRVARRMARQQVLTREPDPLRLSVVLDESVLRRPTGGHAVMADQLDHLAAVASRPNVTLRILPLDAGVHSAGWGGFTVIASEGSTQPQVVCVEDRTGMRYLEGLAVAPHMQVFEHLCDYSLPPDQSADLIRTISKETYQ